jgi:hypothetical protein
VRASWCQLGWAHYEKCRHLIQAVDFLANNLQPVTDLTYHWGAHAVLNPSHKP